MGTAPAHAAANKLAKVRQSIRLFPDVADGSVIIRDLLSHFPSSESHSDRSTTSEFERWPTQCKTDGALVRLPEYGSELASK